MQKKYEKYTNVRKKKYPLSQYMHVVYIFYLQRTWIVFSLYIFILSLQIAFLHSWNINQRY